MYQDVYYVDKSSGTFADALQAFGAAFTLRQILRQGRPRDADVVLADAGAAYELRLSAPIEEAWVECCPCQMGASFLLTPKNGAKLPPGLPHDGGPVVDYAAEKLRREEFFAVFKSLSPEDKRAFMQGRQHLAVEALRGKGVHEHWDIFRALNPGALDAYNSTLAQWWEAQACFPQLLRVLLGMLAATPNDVDAAEKLWADVCKSHGLAKPREATAAQIFNPSQGKGQNRSKPDGATMQNVKGFWLPEYLKAVGLYEAGLTRIVANPRDPRNAKDRKTYVVAPQRIALSQHGQIMKRFREAMTGSATAVKLDILVALRYSQAFLLHAEACREVDEWDRLLGKRPSDLVAGLQMAFYKNLGNSAATMNIATINLPAWVRVLDGEGMGRLQDVLVEHERLIRALDESHSDAYDLLLLYRDFLSGNDLRPFFAFTTAYSGFLISQRERERWCPSLTTTGLEVIVMNSDQKLGEIIASKGFQNIASAIRQSTVIPQGQKARKKGGKSKEGNRYTIRYGLGQRLARKAAYRDDFIAELSAFLHEYSAENAQDYERREGQWAPHLRSDLHTSDLEEIVGLVDDFGAKVICNLLIAYGYAKTPWERDIVDGDELPPEASLDEAPAEDDSENEEA